MLGTPSKIYMVGGVGKALIDHELLAFDRALADAGIADFNLIRVSSIVPPHCQVIYDPPPRNPGMLAPTVYSKISYANHEKPFLVEHDNRNEPILISACIAMATCQDPQQNGVIFEVALHGCSMNYVHDNAVEMVKLAMEDRHLDIAHIYTKSKELYVPVGEAGCVVIAAMMA